jgi:hypothetical protein
VTYKLEARISKMLNGGGEPSSQTLSDLLTETQQAIAQAETNAKAARERAYDPTLAPDLAAARKEMEDSALRLGRLQTMLPRLRQRYAASVAREQAAEARKQSEPLIAERNACADQLRTLLPYLEKLAALFVRITNNSTAISRFHAALPPGMALHIRDAELKARGLDSYSRERPSILKDAILPGLDGKTLWPAPRTESDVTMFAPATFDPRHSPEWGLHREQQNVQAEAKAIEAAKAQEAAAMERWKALSGGLPHWWEKR